MIKKIACMSLLVCTFAIFANPAFAIDSIKMNGKDFVFQLSSNNTHSFTPLDQKSDPLWKEKISFIYADNVKNEEELQSLAIRLRDSYSQKGRLLKALKVDPANNESGKFLLVAVMAGNDTAEAIIARVNIVKNSGAVIVYAHRFYGESKSKDLIAWFEKNGFRMEKEIIDFKSVPSKSVFLKVSK